MANADVLEPAAAKPPLSKAPDTVYVGCKLPNGIILQLCAEEEYREPVMGGGTIVSKRYRRLPETYTLNGCSIDLARVAAGEVPHLIVGGAGITPGIPRDFWEKWLEANKHSHLVRNKIVFAQRDEMSARSRAVELKDVRSGLEPIDPENPGSTSPDVRRIATGTKAA